MHARPRPKFTRADIGPVASWHPDNGIRIQTKPAFTGPGIACGHSSAQLTVWARRHCCRTRMAGTCALRGRMPKASLVSIVEDDRFFRESMGRLMRSLGFAVEAFPS